MLAADKQLLDAHLRNELQQLRRLEITNVVNRFQNALTPATLIAGFSFTSIVELEFTTTHLERSSQALHAEPVFYICSSAALSLALYVTAVSSMGIVFGQRLTIQATASQGSEHDLTVRELNNKFFWVLIALGGSMLAVVVGARPLTTPSPAGKHAACAQTDPLSFFSAPSRPLSTHTPRVALGSHAPRSCYFSQRPRLSSGSRTHPRTPRATMSAGSPS